MTFKPDYWDGVRSGENDGEAEARAEVSRTDLKPCPFCGGEAVICRFKGESLWSRRIVMKTQVSCRECEIETRFTEKGQQPEAVERWNCRAAGEQANEPPIHGADWFALAMGAAASLEDAAYCLRDADAKRAALDAARHVRERCHTLCGAHGITDAAMAKGTDAK